MVQAQGRGVGLRAHRITGEAGALVLLGLGWGVWVMAKYSDVQRAEAMAVLAANGNNLNKTARDTGIPLSTLKKWADGKGHSPDHAVLCMEKKAAISERLDTLVHSMLDKAATKIEDATLKDTMVSIGVAIDKAQLLKGQPTNITENRADPADARRSLADYLFSRRVRDGAGEHAGSGPAASPGDDRGGVSPAVN